MTLWSAAGISVAAAAVATSAGGATETVSMLADLCLSGAAPGDIPTITLMQHSHPLEPSVSKGLGFISAALLTGGLWPGRPEESVPARRAEPDPDRVLAAMAHVASATGGISPPEFAEMVIRDTGLELSADEAALALRSYRGDAEKDALGWIAETQDGPAREAILRAALEVGWTHGRFTPGGLEMIGRIARTMDVSGDDLALLFWEVTEPPLHARADAFERLRPKSRTLGRNAAVSA